jgi:ABC-2 type transport system ATP-binding protein
MKLKIDGVSKQYVYKLALDHFTTELTEGVYGLLGPNGAGKTTLLRILADVLNPSEGKITVDGQDKNTMKEGYRDLIGYLPQDCGFYRNFTAFRFLMYISALKGIEKKAATEKTLSLIKLVNLENEGDKKIGSFSGGMKQRLGIAQALLNDPKILILDEPTAGLDPKERIRFRNIISQISGNRIIILSTHIVSDIEYIAKEIIFLKQGKLIKQGKPQELLEALEGKVWTVNVSEEYLTELERDYKIGNVMRQGEGIEVRIISDTKPLFNAVSQKARLEDMYLDYFDEEAGDGAGADATVDRA